MGELMGLLALLLFQHARQAARMDDAGRMVPLDAQDRTLWNRAMMAQARALLDKAARHHPPGPYQLQARIAGYHAEAATAADTRWDRIGESYAALFKLQPTPDVPLTTRRPSHRPKARWLVLR